ncbi:hypothetical protein MMC20_002313 [Loxospora ochrophaea]|nr:hypothetical protein [Loxospora ochrophaea]
MSHAFSDQALRGMEPHILSVIRNWCAALGDDLDPKTALGTQEWSSPKDMAHWAAYMIFDVLGEICFGQSFDTSLYTDNRFFLDLMTINVRILNILGQMPILAYTNLSTIMNRGNGENRVKQIAFSRQQLRKRLDVDSDSSGRRDIIHYLQQARDPETGEGYSETELMSETTLLLGAGSDTANTALASIFYFLSHHPSVLTRLTTIIRNSFPTVESIVSGPVLASSTYLRACVDEALRLCPPIPMPLPREVLSGGLHVDGEFFPQGTIVGVPTYTLHHSSAHFDRPFAYEPSRWLVKNSSEKVPGGEDGEGQTEETVALAREAFVPFSVGPRACIGRNVALLELQVGVARTLWLYNMRIVPGTESLGVGVAGEYKMKDNFIVGKEGPVLQFQKR